MSLTSTFNICSLFSTQENYTSPREAVKSGDGFHRHAEIGERTRKPRTTCRTTLSATVTRATLVRLCAALHQARRHSSIHSDSVVRSFILSFLSLLCSCVHAYICLLIVSMICARMVHLVPELKSMVCLISASMISFFWAVVLFVLLIYCVAVYFTELATDLRVGADDTRLGQYWGSLGSSFLSLFQAISGGDDWANFIDVLEDSSQTLNTLVFSLYVLFATLVMLNLVTGVFVEGAQRILKDDKEAELLRMNASIASPPLALSALEHVLLALAVRLNGQIDLPQESTQRHSQHLHAQFRLKYRSYRRAFPVKHLLATAC